MSSSRKPPSVFEAADLITYDFTFICGACGNVIKLPTTHKLPCKIHYSCGQGCNGKDCSRCVCDACDRCITDTAFIPACGCCYHEDCIKSVGPDEALKKCAWCIDSPHSRTMSDAVVPEIKPNGGWSDTLFGVVRLSSALPKITKKVATLNEVKLLRLVARGWKPDDFISKPAYSVEAFMNSGIGLKTLMSVGFTTRHISQLGFSMEQFLHCYPRVEHINPTEIKEFAFLVNVSFVDLTSAILGIFRFNSPSEVLEYIKTAMGFTLGELIKLPDTTANTMLTHFNEDTWTAVYGKKEVQKHLRVM